MLADCSIATALLVGYQPGLGRRSSIFDFVFTDPDVGPRALLSRALAVAPQDDGYINTCGVEKMRTFSDSLFAEVSFTTVSETGYTVWPYSDRTYATLLRAPGFVRIELKKATPASRCGEFQSRLQTVKRESFSRCD